MRRALFVVVDRSGKRGCVKGRGSGGVVTRGSEGRARK